MKYDGKEGVMLCKLSTVIDCGTEHGSNSKGPYTSRQVHLGFQMWDYPRSPKDKSLPDYRDYVSGWYNVDRYDGNPLNNILDALGAKETDTTFDALSLALGKLVYLNVENNKGYPRIATDGHKKCDKENTSDRGTEERLFLWRDNTTMDEVNELGFHKSNVKKSDEYKKLTEKEVTQEDIDSVF